MTNFQMWIAVVAAKSLKSGKTPIAVARASKKTRRKVILAKGEVRS